jgi:chromosome segregation ATPase
MAGQAQITSVEALETFRADLIVFLGQMRPVVDEVGSELVRMKSWLQNEQREHWENQARRRRRKLEEAQAELFNARLSTLQDSSILQHMAVQQTQRAVQEAEHKLARLKKWDRELENLADPLVKPVNQLQGFLAADMAKAVAYLTQVVQTLEAYKNIQPPVTGTTVVPPAADPKPTS